MGTIRITFVAAVAASLLGGLSAPGCGDDADGVRLSDAAAGCDGTTSELERRPVALGARLAIQASSDGGDVDAGQVEFSAPGVLRLEELGNPFMVRAEGEGSVEVRFTSADGRRAIADLSVHAISTSELVLDDVTLWNLAHDLEVAHPLGGATLIAGGVALAPDGVLTLRTLLRDAVNEELAGHDIASWTAPETVTLKPVGGYVNDVEVRPSGTGGIEATVSEAHGGALTIGLVPDGVAVGLTVYVPETGATTEALTLRTGDTATLVLVAHDGGGRFVIGSGAGGFHATTSASEDVFALVSPPWAKPEGDLDLDDAAREQLLMKRVAYIRAGTRAGAGTVTLSALGQSLDLPVTVTK